MGHPHGHVYGADDGIAAYLPSIHIVYTTHVVMEDDSMVQHNTMNQNVEV
jgi:hypothetical protein